ncbi:MULTISPECIES: single-stranded DNA-binding protein [Streptomyces]|uniref:Single-stranded DNA-binding protein n=1 Tax=Streptomyces fildesensis TaxID=375757 RepID=A0ABW8CD39_9ACTN|nr:single-stranded DNA-binding protein [Streptomyces sp. RKAG337]
MNETSVTVVGNVVTQPEFRETATGVPVIRFRLETTARRWVAERRAWSEGSTSFFMVRAWRTLAANVRTSVQVGEPLVVRGRLRVREEEHDGRWYVAADIDAVAIGHDLSRGTAAFRRVSVVRPELLSPRPVEMS